MTDLVKYGYVVRGYFGVEAQSLTPELAREFGLKDPAGALVGGVVPKGPADKAGVEVGDIITWFDGHEVQDARQLRLMVADARPCHTVPVEVLRNGSAQPLRVTIRQESNWSRVAKIDRLANYQDPGVLQGVTLSGLSGHLRQQLRIPAEVQGAVVVDVSPYSAAAEAGLKAGDVIESINRAEVKNAEDASRLTQSSKAKRTLLRAWSNGGSHFIVVDESHSG